MSAFFEHARLRVRAVQNRGIGARVALVDPVTQAADDEIRFVTFVIGRVDPDRLALGALGPQVLAQPSSVVRDDRIGRVQDRRRRAVVLFELDDRTCPESLAGSGGYARRAHRASGRSTGRRRRRRTGCRIVAREQAQPRVLDRIGVLELVDQQVLETPLVVGQQVRVVAPELVRAQQQLREVDEPAALADLLVGGVQSRSSAVRFGSPSSSRCCGRRPSSFCALMNHWISFGTQRLSSISRFFSSRLISRSWSSESMIWKFCGSFASCQCRRSNRCASP